MSYIGQDKIDKKLSNYKTIIKKNYIY